MPLLDALSKQNYRCRTDFDHPLSMQRTGRAKRLSRSVLLSAAEYARLPCGDY
jgi:hypothetical protein